MGKKEGDEKQETEDGEDVKEQEMVLAMGKLEEDHDEEELSQHAPLCSLGE